MAALMNARVALAVSSSLVVVAAVALLPALTAGCGSGGGSSFDVTPDASLDPDSASGVGSDASDDVGRLGGDAGADDRACKAAADAHGFAGCDFVFATPPINPEFMGVPCYAAFLANNADVPARITALSYDGKTFDPYVFARVPKGPDPAAWPALPSTGIPPHEVAVLFLAHMTPTHDQSTPKDSLACPITPAMQSGTYDPFNPGRGKSFHLATAQPVTLYDMNPFGGAKSFVPSAALVPATSAWGKNYILIAPPLHLPGEDGSPRESSWFHITAMKDGTHVTIQTPNGIPLEGGSFADTVQGGPPTTITLAAGERMQYFEWRRAPGTLAEVTGSVVIADQPIAVSGGEMALDIATTISTSPPEIDGGPKPPKHCCLDSSHAYVPPVGGFASDYVLVPHPTRRADMSEEPVLHQLVGVVDGTKLTFDPPVAGAPQTLDRGSHVTFEATGAFRVKSQDASHPFYAAQTMSFAYVKGGWRKDGDPGFLAKYPTGFYEPALGDPEHLPALPPAQFLKAYSFFTDPTYATTSLVITRSKDKNGVFHDVTVDCLGVVSGWQPIGAGDFEFTRVDLGRAFQPNGSCAGGAHTAKSDSEFGLDVWGVDWWASYAYPAGGNLAQINDVVVNPR